MQVIVKASFAIAANNVVPASISIDVLRLLLHNVSPYVMWVELENRPFLPASYGCTTFPVRYVMQKCSIENLEKYKLEKGTDT